MQKQPGLYGTEYQARSLYPTMGTLDNAENLIPDDSDQSALIDNTSPVATPKSTNIAIWLGVAAVIIIVFNIGRKDLKV